MKITLKLYATLRHHLPKDAVENATTFNTDDHTTPFNVIDRFQVPRESAHLVLLNGVYVSPADRDQPVLKEGDTLAIWPPVAGG